MFMCDVRSKIKFVTCDVRTPGYIKDCVFGPNRHCLTYSRILYYDIIKSNR